MHMYKWKTNEAHHQPAARRNIITADKELPHPHQKEASTKSSTRNQNSAMQQSSPILKATTAVQKESSSQNPLEALINYWTLQKLILELDKPKMTKAGLGLKLTILNLNLIHQIQMNESNSIQLFMDLMSEIEEEIQEVTKQKSDELEAWIVDLLSKDEGELNDGNPLMPPLLPPSQEQKVQNNISGEKKKESLDISIHEILIPIYTLSAPQSWEFKDGEGEKFLLVLQSPATRISIFLQRMVKKSVMILVPTGRDNTIFSYFSNALTDPMQLSLLAGLVSSPKSHIPMSVLVWNCRGAGNPNFIRTARDLIRMHKPVIVALTETKLKDHTNLIRDLGFIDARSVSAEGQAGGMCILWRRDEVEVEALAALSQLIHVSVQDTHGSASDSGNPACV